MARSKTLKAPILPASEALVAPVVTHGPTVARGKGNNMSIILFVVFGIVAGFIARAIMPGKQSMSIVMTALLGIAGSFVGGFVGSLVTGASVLDFNTSGLIGSVLGALAVLALMAFAGRRSAHA